MDNYLDMTLLRQSQDMKLQYHILVLLGLHRAMTVMEIGSIIYYERPEDELPVATLTLALMAMRQEGLVRKVWFSKHYRLARAGRLLHHHLVEANQAHACFAQPLRA
jgi:hypothetical protein